jgi:hypothetical protein
MASVKRAATLSTLSQKHYSATFISFPFHSCKEKLSTFQKCFCQFLLLKFVSYCITWNSIRTLQFECISEFWLFNSLNKPYHHSFLYNLQNRPYLLATSHAALSQIYVHFIFNSPAMTTQIQFKHRTFFHTNDRCGFYTKKCHKLKQIVPDAPVPKQFLTNLRSFQTKDPMSDSKRTNKKHMLNEELLSCVD